MAGANEGHAAGDAGEKTAAAGGGAVTPIKKSCEFLPQVDPAIDPETELGIDHGPLSSGRRWRF